MYLGLSLDAGAKIYDAARGCFGGDGGGGKMKDYRHLQFWEHADSSPSKNDSLWILAHALDLLSSALPLALKGVVGAAPHEQLKFWWDFIDFEKETDMDGHGGLSEIKCAELCDKLSDWASVARERIRTPKGDLDPGVVE